jgi:hypothetical protein
MELHKTFLFLITEEMNFLFKILYSLTDSNKMEQYEKTYVL